MKILVAEDDRDTRRLLAVILRDHEIIEAKNGEEAVMMAERHQPDIILMDVRMPKLDGFAALERLKASELTASIPVVLMSAAYTRTEDIKRGEELGAVGYLEKPFDADTLAMKVERWARETGEAVGVTEGLLVSALESDYALGQRCATLEEALSTVAYALRVPWRGIEEDLDALLERIEQLMDILDAQEEAAQADGPGPRQ